MKKVIYNVNGMSCAHCEKRVTTALNAISGVKSCVASAQEKNVVCEFDETITNVEIIKNEIIETGYTVL